MPNFAPPITVATFAALADVHVAELDEGTEAWVSSVAILYRLFKSSALAPNGTTVIAPATGSPIAGAAGARWIRQAGTGNGAIVQEVYAENQVRPTVLSEPAPGGLFFTILALAVTTTTGHFLDIEASLGAIVFGGAGATFVDSGIRLLVDGVSTGLGSAMTLGVVVTDLVNFSIGARVPVLPGAHTVELQWFVGGDGAAAKSIGLNNPDLDGCSMFVREVI